MNSLYFFKLTESCEYCTELNHIIMGDDCKDWSKLFGTSYFPTLNAQKNSIMGAWRHHPEEGLQFQPYLHDRAGNSIYKEFEPLNIKKDQYYSVFVMPSEGIEDKVAMQIMAVDVELDSKGKIKKYSDRHDIGFKIWVLDTSKLKLTNLRRQINSWFGGNRPAPQNITFDLDRIT